MTEKYDAIRRPVSTELPSGPDRWDADSHLFDRLKDLDVRRDVDRLEVKPLTEACRQFLAGDAKGGQGCKDLNAAVRLAVGLMLRDGLAGLELGLSLLRDLVVQFWSTVHPAEGRVQILQQLWGAQGEVPFRLRFWDAPLCGLESPTYFRSRAHSTADSRGTQVAVTVTFDRLRSLHGNAGTDAEAVSLRKAVAGLGDANLSRLRQAADASAAHAADIVGFVRQNAEDGASFNIDELVKSLKTLSAALGGFLPVPGGAPGTVPVPDEAGGAGARLTQAGVPGGPVNAAIVNRRELVKTVEGVCVYFAEHEPDSPIRLLALRMGHLLNLADPAKVLEAISPEAFQKVSERVGDGNPPKLKSEQK